MRLSLVATASIFSFCEASHLRPHVSSRNDNDGASSGDGLLMLHEDKTFWDRFMGEDGSFSMTEPPTQTPTTDPLLNSVLSAHGNTDWNIDTASEFLFGTDISGFATAPNYVPDSWTREHMHIGETDTSRFYYDKSLTPSGDDTSMFGGIDRAMLFFYTGHGNPVSFNTLSNSATQSNMLIGNTPASLRYFWQCSCETFAHGPRQCQQYSPFSYACPDKFIPGSSDSFDMRNVYERWGPALGDDLRMACGATTSAYCHEFNVDRIWDNYNNKGLDVADSFIDGLSGWDVVPLCITTGGSDPFSSPLFLDTAFTNSANPSGEYYHIQYLGGFMETAPAPPPGPPGPPPAPGPPPPIPEQLPKLELGTMQRRNLQGTTMNAASGAEYVRGQPVPSTTMLSEAEYMSIAAQTVDELGWTEDLIQANPETKQMWIETIPRDGAIDGAQSERSQKSVSITYRRQIDLGSLKVPVFGNGGLITIQLNNDGSLLSGAKVWRPTGEGSGEPSGALLPTKSYEQAEAEARAFIGDDIEFYVLNNWEWGYKEEAGNVEQTEMGLSYRFNFGPVTDDLLLEYPPQIVEIGGFLEP